MSGQLCSKRTNTTEGHLFISSLCIRQKPSRFTLSLAALIMLEVYAFLFS
jgi:hypothetical protein